MISDGDVALPGYLELYDWRSDEGFLFGAALGRSSFANSILVCIPGCQNERTCLARGHAIVVMQASG
jgi:hypothetical protein